MQRVLQRVQRQGSEARGTLPLVGGRVGVQAWRLEGRGREEDQEDQEDQEEAVGIGTTR